VNIQIPKITKVIELKSYAPEFGEATIEVWVNPPRKLLAEWEGLINKTIALDEYKQMVATIGQLWDCPPEDVINLIDHSKSTDPLLFQWLITKTFLLIKEHRMILKKN